MNNNFMITIQFKKYYEKKKIICIPLSSKIKKYMFVLLFCFIFYYFRKITNTSTHSIHLAISIDEKFLYPGIVFLTSLLDNRVKTSFYNVHVLTGGTLSKKSIEKIESIIDKFGNNFVKLNFYNLNNDFNGSTTGYLPLSTYYKIALPSLLPNVDKIITSDSDMINLEDLTEMYSFKFNEKIYFAGTLDYIDHLKQLREFGLSSDKYINAGLLIMNLKAMREDNIEKKLREFIATHKLKFWEQTAINCVCRNNIQILSYKYGVFAFENVREFIRLNNEQDKKYRLTNEEINKFFDEPTFFHYVSLGKPWLKKVTKFNKVYWWYYAKMSGFYNEILEHYDMDINQVEFLLKNIPNDGGLLKRNYKKNVIYKY